jgi:hypothetical protein
MEEQETVVESLVENVEQYTATTIELAKLKSILKTSDVLSGIATTLVLIVLAFMTVLFLSIGAGLWLGEVIGSVFGGFLLVGGFYAVTGTFIFLLRKRLVKEPIANSIINNMID